MPSIVHLIDNLAIGGAQRLLVTLAAQVRERPDQRMTVVCLSRHEALVPELRASGAEVVVDPGPLRDLARVPRLCRLLRAVEADLVHTHLSHAHMLGAVCGRIVGIPAVATLHNVQEDRTGRPRDRLVGALERMALGGMARVVAVGDRVAAARAAEVGADRLRVVENATETLPPLDPAERAALRAEMTDRPNGFLAVAVGRAYPQKGFDILLDAMALAPPDLSLAIIGGGEELPSLAARVEALGLGDRVRLTGWRADATRLLGAADAFVLSSRWEGLPVALLEAMAAGLPIVATRVGDVPTVLTAESGLLVEPGSAAALAGGLERLLAAPALRRGLGAEARRTVERRFGAARWAERLLALYDEVLAAPAPRRRLAGAAAGGRG